MRVEIESNDRVQSLLISHPIALVVVTKSRDGEVARWIEHDKLHGMKQSMRTKRCKTREAIGDRRSSGGGGDGDMVERKEYIDRGKVRRAGERSLEQ